MRARPSATSGWSIPLRKPLSLVLETSMRALVRSTSSGSFNLTSGLECNFKMCHHDVDVDVLTRWKLHPHPSGHPACSIGGLLLLHDQVSHYEITLTDYQVINFVTQKTVILSDYLTILCLKITQGWTVPHNMAIFTTNRKKPVP